MRIIEEGENGTEIYPLIPEDSEVSDDDFFIAVESNEVAFVDGRMWNQDEISKVIEGLSKALEIMSNL